MSIHEVQALRVVCDLCDKGGPLCERGDVMLAVDREHGERRAEQEAFSDGFVRICRKHVCSRCAHVIKGGS